VQVRLKDVVDYITGIIAHNAISSSIAACVPQLVKAAAADMTSQAEGILCEAANRSGQSQCEASTVSTTTLAQHARLQMDDIAQDIVGSNVTQVCCKCQAWLHVFLAPLPKAGAAFPGERVH